MVVVRVSSAQVRLYIIYSYVVLVYIFRWSSCRSLKWHNRPTDRTFESNRCHKPSHRDPPHRMMWYVSLALSQPCSCSYFYQALRSDRRGLRCFVAGPKPVSFVHQSSTPSKPPAAAQPCNPAWCSSLHGLVVSHVPLFGSRSGVGVEIWKRNGAYIFAHSDSRHLVQTAVEYYTSIITTAADDVKWAIATLKFSFFSPSPVLNHG